MSPRMGVDGDLFVQALASDQPGRPEVAFELNRYSRPDGQALVLSTTEARWLLMAGLPTVLAEAAPLLTPAEAIARRIAAGRARTAQPDHRHTPAPVPAGVVPPAEQPAETVPQAARTGPQDAVQPAPGPGVGYTIRPGSDDEDAPPGAGGKPGGASGTLPIDGMDVGP